MAEVAASWAKGSRPSALQDMLVGSADKPNILSLALGIPDPNLFPLADLVRAATVALEGGPDSLQYAPPSARLKEHVVGLMARRGVVCLPEQVFLTSGAQQGLSLLARVLLEHSGRVVLERLTYTGIRQVLEPYSPELLEVPTHQREWIDLDSLEWALSSRSRPAFVYVIPQGHNPLGVSARRKQRDRLIELAQHYRVPIIEDDAYGLLQYEPGDFRPLRACEEDWICYVGSFSKILAPGLRQGWIIAPQNLVPKLAIAKESADINSTTVGQAILAAYLDAGRLPSHLKVLCDAYRDRRDALMDGLDAYFPDEAQWSRPDAGFFVWVTLPRALSARDVHRKAMAEHVAFIPGDAFSAGGRDGRDCMRLSFSGLAPEQLTEAVQRLGGVVERLL